MSDRLSRLYALGYDLLLQGIPETFILGPRRSAVISSVRGLVLEIGAGTGLSLRYYSPAARVVATDIDLAGLERLAGKALDKGRVARVAVASAERLPFPDGAFDALVCNLALCTIPDPTGALAEARRVLKPGAPARFLEHVRAGNHIQARGQDLLAPAWARMAGGCRLNQDTERIVRASGLTIERVVEKRGLLLPMKLIWARNPSYMKGK